MVEVMTSSIVMHKTDTGRDAKGTCPNPKCGKTIYESLVTLDDCYGLSFRCPYCNAIMFLDNSPGRWYSSEGMYLVLPLEAELEPNKFPANTPTIENPNK